MNVHLKCFATLANPESCDFRGSMPYELRAGQTVKDLVKRAGLKAEDIRIAFVNGRIVGLDTVLSEGDQVGLAPAVGGM